MSRSQEEILADYKQRLQNLIGRKLKLNPNHYPIINKWNYKYIYKPHSIEIFRMMEEALDELAEVIIEERIKNYATLNFGEALESYFIRHPEIYEESKKYQDSFPPPVFISIDAILGEDKSFTEVYKEETMKKHWNNIINGEEKESYGTFRPSE